MTNRALKMRAPRTWRGRIKRWASRGAWALSLLVFVLAVAGWIRSHMVFDALYPPKHQGWPALWGMSFAGSVQFCFVDQTPATDHTWRHLAISRAQVPNLQGWPGPRVEWHWLGIGFGHESNATGTAYFHRQFVLLLPYWFFVVVSLVWPMGWLVLRWWRRGAAGEVGGGVTDDVLCERCGYDLRASTATCPECGTPIPQSDA